MERPGVEGDEVLDDPRELAFVGDDLPARAGWHLDDVTPKTWRPSFGCHVNGASSDVSLVDDVVERVGRAVSSARMLRVSRIAIAVSPDIHAVDALPVAKFNPVGTSGAPPSKYRQAFACGFAGFVQWKGVDGVPGAPNGGENLHLERRSRLLAVVYGRYTLPSL